jgi:HEAT repeat protein
VPLRTPLVILAVLMVATSLPAQGSREIPGRRDRPGRTRLDLPTGKETIPKPTPVAETPLPAEPGGLSGPQDPDSFWGTPQGRAEEIFAALESKGELNRRQIEKALDNLRALGLETRATALKALRAPHSSTVLLAARLLEWVGDPAAGDPATLVETSSRVGNVAAAAACLDASLRLNGGRIPARAVSLLSHPQRQLRSLAEARLAKSPNLEYLTGLLQQVGFGREADSRHRAARLLSAYVDQPEARQALRNALADHSVQVAFEAADALGGVTTPENAVWLEHQIVEGGTDAEKAYLFYAFLRQQELGDARSLSEELLAKLFFLLDHENIFLAGTAGALVATQIFQYDIPAKSPDLNRRIAFSLVRAVGGEEFYPQYARFSPLAEFQLQKITGESFPEGARDAWIHWFTKQEGYFQFVSGAIPLGEDFASLRISWAKGTGRLRMLTGFTGDDGHPQTRVLGPAALDALVASLQNAEVLGTKVLPGTYGLLGEPVTMTLLLENQGHRKPIRFRGANHTPWVGHLLDTLDSFWEAYPWQMLAKDEGRQEFLNERLEIWEAASESRRSELLVEWSLTRLSMLNREEIVAWCQLFHQTPNIDQVWNQEIAFELLGLLSTFADDVALCQTLLSTALIHPDPAWTSFVLQEISKVPARDQFQLLNLGFQKLGSAATALCVQDSRLEVRKAAVNTLGSAGAEGVPQLLNALTDPNSEVVQIALQSLAQTKDPRAFSTLRTLSGPGNAVPTRQGALAALGLFKDSAALGEVLLGLRAQDAGLRLTALNSLVQLPGEKVNSAFVDLAPEFLDSPLAASFTFALESRGAGLARRIYRSLFDHGNQHIRMNALHHAARLGEPDTVSRLMDLLSSRPRDPEVLTALAHSTGADFRDMPDPFGIYTIWWRDHQSEAPSLWLVNAIQGQGFTLEKDFLADSGASLAEVVTDLVAVLLDGPSHLRALTCRQLELLTGVDLPPISPGTSREVAAISASPWLQWIADSTAE